MALYQVYYFVAIPFVGVTIAALVTLCMARVMVTLWNFVLAPLPVGYLFFLHGIRFTEAAVASIVNLYEPMTSTVLAWLLSSEQLVPIAAAGAMLLLSAMVFLSRRS